MKKNPKQNGRINPTFRSPNGTNNRVVWNLPQSFEFQLTVGGVVLAVRSRRDGDLHLLLLLLRRRRCRRRRRAAGFRACGSASSGGGAAAIWGVPRREGARRLRPLHAPPDPLVIPNLSLYFSCSILGFGRIYGGCSGFPCKLFALGLIGRLPQSRLLFRRLYGRAGLWIWSISIGLNLPLWLPRATFVPDDVIWVLD